MLRINNSYFVLEKFKIILSLLLFFIFSFPIVAKDLSLTEVLEIKTSVSSLRELSSRESPGIISVITDDEIEKSGAKDILDVLRNVPGFYFSTDLVSTVNLVSRGMSTAEGKVLIMVDGLEQNEQVYGTLPLANHYPVAQIKKIEIIRGPGSVIYGGFAGLNVINIVTKKGDDLRGGEFELTSGEMKDAYGHNSLSMIYGQEKDGFKGSVGGFVGRSNLSDRDYKDYPPYQADGRPISMASGSRIDPHFLNAGIEYNGFEFRTQQDSYQTTNRDGWAAGNVMEDEVHFLNNIVNAKKTIKIAKLKITPEWTFIDNSPFYNPEPMNDMIDDNEIRQRATTQIARLLADYNLTDENNIIIGVEKRWKDYQLLNTWTDRDPPQKHPALGFEDSIKARQETAYFAQYMHMSKIGNVTLGVRQDDVENRDKITVPRIGYTNIINKIHFKVLWAKSFREPTMSSLEFGDLNSEKITTTELEFGYQISTNLFANLNFYNSLIDNPIAYGFDFENN
ncbi:MAG: TonB-dependent receptor plug domain-containing protein, partial [Oligoflexales bacterium]|nr:TonB-dependent receptor plug domain-containing protein [Oligoflexales bacterium]